MKMDEEWPDHFEERSRPSATRIEEEGERKHDAMANMVARPESLQRLSAPSVGLVRYRARRSAMCDRIIYNLDANGYLQGRLEDLLDPDAPPNAD